MTPSTGRLTVEERREQLVSSALEIALEEGVEAVTVRRVAARAGVSLGLVHYSFDSKEHLLEAVAAAVLAASAEAALVPLVPGAGADLRTVLRATVRALWRQLTATPQQQLLTYELTTYGVRRRSATVGAPATDPALAQHLWTYATVKEVLERAARTAGVRWTTPVSRVARLVQATLDGACLAWLVDGDARASAASMELLADQLVALTEPRPPRRSAAG
jgi:AcrR family transcriptional regulator